MKAFLLVKSSTRWLTKAVDIAVRLQLPVVTYTSPACPAGYPLYIAQCGTNVKPGFIWCGQLNLTIQLGLSSTQQMRKPIQVQFELILHPSPPYATPALCILLGCWSLRKLGELLWLER